MSKARSKVGAKPIDRILWNRGRKTVDEVVVHNCTIHLEQMTDQGYWMGVYKGDNSLMVNLWVDGGRKPLLCRVDDDGPEAWGWDEDGEHL